MSIRAVVGCREEVDHWFRELIDHVAVGLLQDLVLALKQLFLHCEVVHLHIIKAFMITLLLLADHVYGTVFLRP